MLEPIKTITIEEATNRMIEAMKAGYTISVRINGEETPVEGKCNGKCLSCDHCFLCH